MIFLTKLGGKRFMLNEALIESISQTPDTIIVMNTGHSFIVMESMDEIMQTIVDFNRSCKKRTLRRPQDASE